MPELDRRTFLGASAFALASGIASAADPPEWFDRPMRWAQLTLVEDDPGQFDVNFWIDYFRRTHSDAACLSAGGCVAFYPTQVPLHYRSQWLGDRDPFGDLTAGCRKLGMVVIARTDPHAVHQDAYDAHPAWIASNPYALGFAMLDSNGNVQVVTRAGTSKTGTHPTWSTTINGATADSTVRWRNAGLPATVSLAAAGGTSGIIIDNTVSSSGLAGASNVYFSTLSNQVCGTTGTGGCAVQASQAALN